MLNYKDFTLKACLKNRIIVEQKLLDLGAIFQGEDYQQDYYFRVSNGKLKYRKGTLKTLITHYERFILDNIEKTSVYRYDINPSEEDVKKCVVSLAYLIEVRLMKKLKKHNKNK